MLKKISIKQIQINKEKKEQSLKRHLLFLEIWDERADKFGNNYCFETGKLMKSYLYRNNSCTYSHYLPKNKYPEYDLEKWNIEIVLPEIHAQWEINQDKCPKLKEKYLYLKNKLIPLYKDLVELYRKGELNEPTKNQMICYHLSEERRELGDNYIIFDHWNNFVNGVKLLSDIEKEKFKILWKT